MKASSKYSPVRTVETSQPPPTPHSQLRGYFYALLFTLFSCIYIILVKLAPTYHAFQHGVIRYAIQLLIMSYFIKSTNSEWLGPSQSRKLLLARGLVGAGAIIFGLLSLNYLSPSDVEAITNSSIIMTAVLGKLFLHEKITISHLVALVLTILGVLFILRPPVLTSIESGLVGYLFTSNTTENASLSTELKAPIPEALPLALGVAFILVSSLCQSLMHITGRKLLLSKISFSVVSIYPAYFGLPLSIAASVVISYYKSTTIVLVPDEIAFMCAGGVLSTVSIIFLSLSLEHVEASRVVVLRTTGVLFVFVFQYLFLGVGVDLTGACGAVLIVLGTLIIMLEKTCSASLKK